MMQLHQMTPSKLPTMLIAARVVPMDVALSPERLKFATMMGPNPGLHFWRLVAWFWSAALRLSRRPYV